ncbi:MAG: DNA-binding protein [Peptococcaceae bacterium]|nr:DNA-binding protein [Peptococcaceae bacterium]
MDETGKNLICGLCNKPLKLVKTEFKYMDSNFHHDLLTCESCGQVYIPYELVKTRIRQVETELEDK